MKKLLLSFCLVSLSCFFAQAQWVSNGPYGGWVACSCPVGNNLYVGTTTGIFRSTDGGETYSLWSQNLPVSGCEQLFFDGTTMYAGVNQLGVYISQDTGKTWTLSQTGIGKPYQFDYPFVQANGKVYTHNVLGCFYTSNHGQSWTQLIYPGNLQQYFALFTAIGNTLFKVCSSKDSLYRSVDEGQHWSRATGLHVDPDYPNITHIAKAGNALYLFCQVVYKSTDDGVTWTEMTHHVLSIPPYDVPFVPAKLCFDGQTFYGTNGGNQSVIVCKIAPGDTQWVNITHSVPDGFSTVMFNSGSKIMINKDNSLFETTNGGSSWALNNNSGLICSVIYATFADQSTIYSGRETDLFRSGYNGQSWNVLSTSFPNSVAALYKFGNNLLAAGVGVQYSTDNGEVWSNPTLSENGIDAFTDDGTNVYAGGSHSDNTYIGKSTDGGKTYDDFRTGLPHGVVLDLIALGNNIYAAVGVGQDDTAGIYKTSTDNPNWKLKSNGLYPYTPVSLAKNGSTLYAGVDGGGVFQSTDFAETWAPLGTGIENRDVNSLVVLFNDLFAGTDSGVYVLHDGTSAWEDISANLPIRDINSLSINSAFLFAGTSGAATWQIPVTAVGIKSVNDKKEDMVIYPNPSGGTFFIVPGKNFTGKTDLLITDDLGRIVFQKQFMNPAGSIPVNATNWSNGVYFVKVSSGENSIVQKLVLNRN